LVEKVDFQISNGYYRTIYMAAADDKKNMICNCGCGHNGRHWTFFFLRTIITVLILMIVFWFGVQVGRISGGYAHDGFMMRGDYGQAMPMMRTNGSTSTPVTTPGVPQNY
jgi:hypothetical protein